MDIQWPLVIFTLLAAWGGMTLAFVGVSELMGFGEQARKKAAALSLVLMFVGGCASVLHLGQPANIMAAAANLFSFSAISLEMIALGFALVACAAYLLAVRGGNATARKAVGVVGILAGVILSFVTGSGYMMDSQPLWNNIALPLGYLGSGLSMGAFSFASLMLASGCDMKEPKGLGTCLLACAAIALVTFLIYAAMTGFQLDLLAFWVGAVCVGGLAPMACAIAWGKSGGSLLYVGLALSVVGALCFRVTMWLAGAGYLHMFAVAAAHGVL